MALLRQNGRLLLRLDELEARLDGTGTPSPAVVESHVGLPLGTTAPAFSLSGLYGETVTLEALLARELPLLLLFTDPGCGLGGTPVSLSTNAGDTLVVFWNPTCGFCQRMLDELRAWEQAPPAGAPRLLLVSRGSVEENQAQGLQTPILLDQSFATANAFGASGTPMAVLIDREGMVASELAAGAPAVMALAGVSATAPDQHH
jgi:peroxiredoxin